MLHIWRSLVQKPGYKNCGLHDNDCLEMLGMFAATILIGMATLGTDREFYKDPLVIMPYSLDCCYVTLWQIVMGVGAYCVMNAFTLLRSKFRGTRCEFETFTVSF